MVMVLFLLIIMMLVDRIVYSTYSFKQPEENLMNKFTYSAVEKLQKEVQD